MHGFHGPGWPVLHLNSAGAAIEETFSVLLGLGSVFLSDVFPRAVSLSAAEALLGALVYYLRVLLFVMILSQYFMATLGAEFSRLKYISRVLHARSIGADVTADIAPEVQLRMQHLTKRMQGGVARYRTGAVVTPAIAAKSISGSRLSIGSSKEALQLLQSLMSDPGSGYVEQCSDNQAVVNVLGKPLDLQTLQQLLLKLATDSSSDQLLHMSASGRGQEAPAGADADGATTASHDVESAPAAEARAEACASAAAAVAQLLGSLHGCGIRNIGSSSTAGSCVGGQQWDKQLVSLHACNTLGCAHWCSLL
jgi:hypothetical protein